MKKFTTVKDVKDIDEQIDLALRIKQRPFEHRTIGKNKTIVLLFFNPSLRTRLSTQKAAMQLGMDVMVMNIGKEGWALEMEDGSVMNQNTAEHIKEAVGVVAQYADIIGIRTFPSLKDREEDYGEKVINQFIQFSGVPVVSLESATLHPLQSLADLITIREYQKKSKPKVVLSWAPHPRALPQAVANSTVEWMNEYEGVDLVITNPEGFDLCPEITNGVQVIHKQEEAMKGADFVYVKNWSSYESYGAIGSGLENWMISKEKMALTNNGHFMHCLPVRRNVVVADKVIDAPESLVLQQSNNRTYAAQSVLLKMLQHEN